MNSRIMNLGREMGVVVVERSFKQDGVWKMVFYGYPVIWSCGKGTSLGIRPMFIYWHILLILMHKVARKMTCLAFNKCSILIPLPVCRIMTRRSREISWR